MSGKKTYLAAGGLILLAIARIAVPEIVTEELFGVLLTTLLGLGGMAMRAGLKKVEAGLDAGQQAARQLRETLPEKPSQWDDTTTRPAVEVTDRRPPSPPAGPALVVLLCVAAVVGGGCLSAPDSVRAGQAAELQALRQYRANVDKLTAAQREAYLIERRASIAAATQRATAAAIAAAGQDGTITPEEAAAVVAAVQRQRDQALADTQGILTEFALLEQQARKPLDQALRLNAATNEWANTGLGEDATSGITDALVELLQTTGGPGE